MRKVPQCGILHGELKMYMSCHNVELEMKNYQLRCVLAIVSSRGGTATQGSKQEVKIYEL